MAIESSKEVDVQSKEVEILDDQSKETLKNVETLDDQSKETLENVETLDDQSTEIEASSSSTVDGASPENTNTEDTLEGLLEDESEKNETLEDEAASTVDGAVAITENTNPEAESIMEPSFTILKGSKKTTQNTRLTSGLPMKRKHHLCCRTCIGDDAFSPLCNILEDRQELCLCQQAKGIKEDDDLGIVGDKKLVYMERVRATPHGNEIVRYADVSFTGETQRCSVCCSDIGHRYLGTSGRDDGKEMVMSDVTREMMLMVSPIQRHFLLDRKKLKIVKVTFSKAKQLGEKSS